MIKSRWCMSLPERFSCFPTSLSFVVVVACGMVGWLWAGGVFPTHAPHVAVSTCHSLFLSLRPITIWVGISPVQIHAVAGGCMRVQRLTSTLSTSNYRHLHPSSCPIFPFPSPPSLPHLPLSITHPLFPITLCIVSIPAAASTSRPRGSP